MTTTTFQRMPGTSREDEVRSIIVGALQYVEDNLGFASVHAPDYVKEDGTLVGWRLWREIQAGRTVVAREHVRNGEWKQAFPVIANLRNDLAKQAVEVSSIRCRRELLTAVEMASFAAGAVRMEGIVA